MPVTLTTTPSIEGKHITKYCGIVTGEAILGANIFKDLFGGQGSMLMVTVSGTAVVVE